MNHDTPSQEELLRLLLEQAVDHVIILLDRKGLVVGWNGAAERTFGHSAAEMIGGPLNDLFTAEDLERGVHLNELEVARQEGRAADDRWQVRKDGTRVWVTGVLIPLKDEEGNIIGFGKVLRDRTDVRGQLDSLLNAGERQKVFLGTLAHELRNPLSPLTNALDIIRLMPPCAETLSGPLQTIERQVDFIRRLVEDLVEFTRVGTNKVRLEMRTVAIEDILRRASDACLPLAEQRQQTLRTVLLPSPTIIEADPDRIEQVAINLLTNAVKYTPDGGKIWLKGTVEGAEAVFRVEDTGVGIDADMLPRIFELFTQEESSLSRSQGGLGLGLSIVKSLVTLHGGSVQVRSEGRGKGSEFTVRLPLRRSSTFG